MFAKQRLEPPAAPEILTFPEKPTLKDLIGSDANIPALSFDKTEEKPKKASPLFYVQPEPEEQNIESTQPSQPVQEVFSPPLVLADEANIQGPEAPPPSDPIEQGPNSTISSIMTPHEETDKASSPHPIITAPAYRHFVRLNEIRQKPSVYIHDRARLACMMAIVSCASVGIVCCITIISLLTV